MSHAAGIVIPAVDMLLIKPSWWARAGAGTRACQMVCVSRTERNGKNHDHDR